MQSIEMPVGNIRDYLDLDLVVSSEEWNMTMRRETEIMRYQLLKDYLTGMMGMVQLMVNPQIPSDAKKFTMQVNDVGSRAITKVLENFEDTEPESTVVDMRKSIDVEKCIQNSIDIQMQMQQQAMAEEEQAKAMLAEQGIMPPEEMAGEMGGQEQGQPGQEQAPQMKAGNTAFTLNIKEGDKGKK
jgi:hypothetical protein